MYLLPDFGMVSYFLFLVPLWWIYRFDSIPHHDKYIDTNIRMSASYSMSFFKYIYPYLYIVCLLFHLRHMLQNRITKDELNHKPVCIIECFRLRTSVKRVFSLIIFFKRDFVTVVLCWVMLLKRLHKLLSPHWFSDIFVLTCYVYSCGKVLKRHLGGYV